MCDSSCRDELMRLLKLRQRRNDLEDKLQRAKWFLEFSASHNGIYNSEMTPAEAEELIQQLEEECQTVATEHRTGLKEHHERFHHVWGRLDRCLGEVCDLIVM